MGKLFVALAATAVVAFAFQCRGTVKDVKNHRAYEFDLSMLHHNDSTYVDKLWYRTQDNTIYYVNFCGQTASACESDDTSVCMRIPDGDDYKYMSGGSTSTQTISIAEDPKQSPSSSVTVTYSHGDKCGNGYYKTKIYVNCQQTAVPGYFYNIDQPNECEATLYMWSAAGCGKEVPYVVSSSSSPDPSSCSAIITDMKSLHQYLFDLSSLHQNDASQRDALWFRSDDDRIYYVNFCGPTKSCNDDDTSVCIRVPSGSGYKYVNGGSTSTQNISIAEAPGQSPSSSVTVTYSNGDKCGNGYYKTKIYVNCQQNAHPGYFYSIEFPNECEAILYMWSSAGCGKDLNPPRPSSEPLESCSPMGSKPLLSMMIIALIIMALFM